MMNKINHSLIAALLLTFFLPVTAHAANMEKGGASDMSVSGAAGGASSEGAAGDLEYCPDTLGTIAVEEDQSDNWYSVYQRRYPELGSTIPVIRLMIQQSNCFVVVERGRAMGNLMQERALEDSGELRGGSNFGKGQMVSADYTISPKIQFSEKGTGGIGGAIGGLFGGSKGRVVGALAGGLKSNEASTTLLLIDNRSSVQVSASTGNAKNMDFALGAGIFGGGGGGGLGGFSDTPEGKVITAAFVDSYNQMVRALRNYRAQTVEGGLGKGGRLEVGQ